jgi:hypothetical protein
MIRIEAGRPDYQRTTALFEPKSVLFVGLWAASSINIMAVPGLG